MENEEVKKFFQAAGRKGGLKTKERGSEYYREIGRKGAKTRWAKQKQNGGNTEGVRESETPDKKA